MKGNFVEQKSYGFSNFLKFETRPQKNQNTTRCVVRGRMNSCGPKLPSLFYIFTKIVLSSFEILKNLIFIILISCFNTDFSK